MVLFVAGGCATAPREPTDRYSDQQLKEMGRRFLAGHDLGQALKFLTMAEGRRPNDAEIQYELGLAYYERGMRSDAFLHMKKALELRPDYPEVENALGRFHADQDQLDLAQRSFERATANRFYSTPHLAFFNLGLIYEKKGNPDAALRQYQEAVRLQPSYGLAYFRMGQLLEETGRKDEAREAYVKVIEFAPDIAEAYYRYGVLCYNSGEYRVAARSFDRVLQLVPYSTMAEDSGRYLELLEEAVSARMLARRQLASPHGEGSQLDPATTRELQDRQLSFQLPPAAETSTLRIPPADGVSRSEVTLGQDPGASDEGHPGSDSAQPVEAGIHASLSSLDPSSRPGAYGDQPGRDDSADEPLEHPTRSEESGAAKVADTDSTPLEPQELEDREARTTGSSDEENLALEHEAIQETKTVDGESTSLSHTSGNVAQNQHQEKGQRSYIVRVASFRDKEDAEKLRQRLLKKGFEASIKPIGSQGMGRLYVVQLKPVSSYELADQQLLQVKKVRRGKMKIIEEPGD
jgi:tetratricopeptide (TPR) repeat protein